jgi:hypothetical protein
MKDGTHTGSHLQLESLSSTGGDSCIFGTSASRSSRNGMLLLEERHFSHRVVKKTLSFEKNAKIFGGIKFYTYICTHEWHKRFD